MKLGVVFPGQGSQIEGMGRDLCNHFPEVRQLYQEASEILGFDLFKAVENRNGEFQDTRIVQPAILVHSYACWLILKKHLSYDPILMAGHSLGELSAVVCAGGLEFSKAVELVKLRAELMASCVKDGGMAVVFGLDKEILQEVCQEASEQGDIIEIANYNSSEQLVVSGYRKALMKWKSCFEERGGVVKIIDVSIPAHSSLMAPALSPFEEAIRNAYPKDCSVPIVSCSTGEIYKEGAELSYRLSRQLVDCVHWPLTISTMLQQGVEVIVELGPKTVLRDLIRLQFPKVRAVSFEKIDDLESVKRLLESGSSKSTEYLAKESVEYYIQTCLCLIVGTPTVKEHTPIAFEQLINGPYRELQKVLDEVREINGEFVESFILRKATEMTLRVLRAKGLSKHLIYEMVKQIAHKKDIQDAVAEYLP